MSLRQLIGCSAATLVGAGAILASATATQAVTLPVTRHAATNVQHVDCAIGAHIGPLGAASSVTTTTRLSWSSIASSTRRILKPPTVAQPSLVTRTDSSGDSETRTKTNC